LSVLLFTYLHYYVVCKRRRYKFVSFPLLSKVEIGPNNCKKIITAAGISGHEMGKTKVSF